MQFYLVGSVRSLVPTLSKNFITVAVISIECPRNTFVLNARSLEPEVLSHGHGEPVLQFVTDPNVWIDWRRRSNM